MLAALVLAAVLTTSCPPNSAGPCTIRQQSIVTKYVGTPFTISWPCPLPPCWSTTDGLFFQVEMVEAKLVDPATPTAVHTSANIAYPTMGYTFTPARAGLYYVRVRACDPTGCSRWANSWDPQDAESGRFPRGFLLQTLLAPTTPGVG